MATLGDTQINWGRRILSWKIHEQWVTLVGDPMLRRDQVSLNSLEKVARRNGLVYLLEFTELFENQQQCDKRVYTAEVQSMVDRYT